MSLWLVAGIAAVVGLVIAAFSAGLGMRFAERSIRHPTFRPPMVGRNIEDRPAYRAEKVLLEVTEALHERLERSDLTRMALAARCGIDLEVLEQWLSGEVQLTLGEVALVAWGLNFWYRVDPSDRPLTENHASIAAWVRATFGEPRCERSLERVLEEMDELKTAVAMGLSAELSSEEVVEEMADVVICMHAAAAAWSVDLDEAVGRKMYVNRRRTWRTDGDGTGYHVKPADETPDASSGGE